MPVRIIITDGDWSSDQKLFVQRGTLPQTISGLTNGTAYTVSNTATSEEVTPFSTYDPDAQAFFDRVMAAGIEPTPQRKDLINGRFIAGKATSWWTKLDALWVHAAHGPEAGRLNWLQARFNCLPVNDPAFTVDRGYMGDGVTSYLDTQFNPATATNIKYSQNEGCLAIRSNTDNAQAGSLAGFFDGTKGTTINPRDTSSRGAFRVNQAAILLGTGGSGPTSIGMFAVNRESASTIRMFRDGVQVVGSASTPSTTPANGTFRLGSISNDSLRACQFSMGYIGGNLTAAEHQSIYEWFQPYRTAVGVP